MNEQPEALRDGRYAIVRMLGEGGQAATFEAADRKTGNLVAIKRFRVHGAQSWKEVELAEREARVLASIAHPALPRYVEHFEQGGDLYLVTELIEGESLAELKKRGVRLGEADVVRLLREASAALEYLHGRAPPLIHRDLKPSNVIRRRDGSFAFIDFGSVRDRMRPEGGSTVVGTFGYMAPEQFQGRALPASDVYAIGATAVSVLTGREPEDLPHRGLALDVHAALGAYAGSRLTRALEWMLEPDPDRRAASLGPVLAELDRGATTRSPSPSEARERGREPRADDRAARRQERREHRRERHAARRERRRQARGSKERPPSQLPALIVVAMTIGLTAAQLAVILALRVVVPMVLVVLSLVFGRGLRVAAEQVANAGRVAGEALSRAKEIVAGAPPPFEPPRIRVDPRRDASPRAADEARARETQAEDEAAEADAEAHERDNRRETRR